MANLINGITIISTAADGTQGNADSGAYNGGGFFTGTDSFSLSADGTKVAFISDATNLVPGDSNGLTDVFVKDLTTGAITLASTVTGAFAATLPSTVRTTVARSLHPSLSPDGTKVVFDTTPFINTTPSGGSQVVIKDLATGTITLLTGGSLGGASPVFSPDGTKIAFSSAAALTSAGTGRAGEIYLEDLRTGSITLVSASAGGLPGNAFSSEPTFSPDGTKIAFTSLSSNLGANGQNTDVYVKDLVTGAITRVSTNAAGQQGTALFSDHGDSANPAFSPDGTKVAFQSSSDGLVPGDNDGITDIFIKDLATGAITRITTLANGTSEGGYGPAFSPDGTKIAFWSSRAGYITNDEVLSPSIIYIKNLSTGAFSAVTPIDPGATGAGSSNDPQFSKDGSKLVFWSENATLVAQDANGTAADIFVKTLVTTPVNTPPVAVTDSYTTTQGAKLTVAAPAGLLANDTDAENNALTALLVSNPAHGALTLASDGSFTYTPATGYAGADSFTYKASDGLAQSAAATVSLTVTAILSPVVAVNDSYAVSNASPASDFLANVLTNDSAPAGGLLALGIVVGGVVQTGFVRTVAGGQADVFSDGRLIYDQPFSSDASGLIRYNGIDSFVYRVRDSDGSTADATVTLTVGTGANHPVTAVDDSYTVSNAFPTADFNVNAANGILANDTSLDGGLVALGLVVDGVVQTSGRTAAGGSVTVFSDGRILYDQPFRSDDVSLIRYNGIDSFVYRVRDSDGSTADATVTLTVGTGANHPVTAVDDSYTVSNAFPTADFNVGAANGVLANDTSLDGGLVVLGVVVDGVVQTGTVKTAAGGTLNVFADGRLIYDQPFHIIDNNLIRYDGTDRFVYRVRDADGSTADATVTLTVGATALTTIPNHGKTITLGSGDSNVVVSGYRNQVVGTGVTPVTVSITGIDNTVRLGNGKDVVTTSGNGGSSTITLGNGDDRLTLGTSSNQATLGDGADAVTSTGFHNTIRAGNGTDSVTGGTGQSTVILGNGNDTVSLGGWVNSVTVGDGHDSIDAGAGGATIVLGAGNDAVMLHGYGNKVTGGNGRDTVTGGAMANIVTLGNGDDTVQLGGGLNVITLGDGHNIVSAGSEKASVTVGKGVNGITLAGSDNVVVGDNGADTVTGTGSTHDSITLGDGADTVTLDGNYNTVRLGNGADHVTLFGQANTVVAGHGGVSVTGGTGNNNVTLGPGTNVVSLGGWVNNVTIGGGTSTVDAGLGSSTIQVDGGDAALTLHGRSDVVFLHNAAQASLADFSAGLRLNIDSGDVLASLAGFGAASGAVLNLAGAGFASVKQVLAGLHSDGNGGTLLALGGTGSVDFLGLPSSELHAVNFAVG